MSGPTGKIGAPGAEGEPTWTEIAGSFVQRFEVAAAIGGTASWNAVGSKAAAEVLKGMSETLDRAVLEVIPDLHAELARLRAENASLRAELGYEDDEPN